MLSTPLGIVALFFLNLPRLVVPLSQTRCLYV